MKFTLNENMVIDVHTDCIEITHTPKTIPSIDQTPMYIGKITDKKQLQGISEALRPSEAQLEEIELKLEKLLKIAAAAAGLIRQIELSDYVTPDGNHSAKMNKWYFDTKDAIAAFNPEPVVDSL